MKKSLILLPILMLSLAACNNNNNSGSTSTSKDPSAQPSASTSASAQGGSGTSTGTSASTPAPEKNYGVVDTPEANVAYKVGMKHTVENSVLYLKDSMDGFYIASSANAEEAADVFVETTEGGYHMFVMKGEAKTYIEIEKSGTHTNAVFKDTASMVWTYKAEWKTMIATLSDGNYFLGTSGTYKTFGAVKDDVAHASYIAHFYADGATGEYPVIAAPEVPDPTHAGTLEDPYTVADAILVAKKTGTTATTEQFYIKGVATRVDNSGVTKYGNISVDIKDADADNKFTCYQIYDLEGVKFTDARKDAVEVDDTIVVLGNIVNYNNNTPETTGKGAAKLVSVEKAPEVPLESITGEDVEVETGKSKAIVLTFAPEKTKQRDVTFVSADPAVATVDAEGKVTGVAVGTTTVTVTSAVNNAITATVNVNVIAADPNEKSVAYDFSTIPNGSDLTAEKVLARFNTYVQGGATSIVTAVTAVTSVYDASNTQGPMLSGLKFGTKSAAGTFTLATSVDVKKVEVTFASWNATTTATVDVNGVNVSSGLGTPETLEIVLTAASNSLVFTCSGRPVITAITFYYSAA